MLKTFLSWWNSRMHVNCAPIVKHSVGAVVTYRKLYIILLYIRLSLVVPCSTRRWYFLSLSLSLSLSRAYTCRHGVPKLHFRHVCVCVCVFEKRLLSYTLLNYNRAMTVFVESPRHVYINNNNIIIVRFGLFCSSHNHNRHCHHRHCHHRHHRHHPLTVRRCTINVTMIILLWWY